MRFLLQKTRLIRVSLIRIIKYVETRSDHFRESSIDPYSLKTDKIITKQAGWPIVRSVNILQFTFIVIIHIFMAQKTEINHNNIKLDRYYRVKLKLRYTSSNFKIP